MNHFKNTLSVILAALIFLSCSQAAFAVVTVSDGSFEYTYNGSSWELFRYVGAGGEVVLPDEYNGSRVKKINERCFEGSSVTSVTVPVGYSEIGSYAFYGCESLSSVSIGSSVTQIGEGAFAESGLTGIDLSDLRLGVIEPYLFKGCSALRTAALPDSVGAIGTGAFRECALESISIPDKVNVLGSFAFFGTGSLGEVLLPPDLTEIGRGCFEGSGIEALELPESVLSIGEDAFRDSSLKSIYIPNAVSEIGANALFPMSVQSTVEVTCFEGSYADDYCYENYVNSVKRYRYIRGDANLDGLVNILDATKIQKYKAGLTALEGPCARLLADTNLDNSISVRDATLIQMRIAEIITEFPK